MDTIEFAGKQFPAPKAVACDCGAEHAWIVWRGYTLGPVRNEDAEALSGMLVQVLPLAELIAPDAGDKLAALPDATPCRGAE